MTVQTSSSGRTWRFPRASRRRSIGGSQLSIFGLAIQIILGFDLFTFLLLFVVEKRRFVKATRLGRVASFN